jgi:hypothetical protein
MHASALAIFHRLGASIEEQGGDAYKSKSMKMVRFFFYFFLFVLPFLPLDIEKTFLY